MITLKTHPENHRGSHNPPTIRKAGSLYLPPDAAPGPLGLSFDNRELVTWVMRWRIPTLQEINISHLGKRKIIFKMDFSGDMLVPRRVLQDNCMLLRFLCWMQWIQVSQKNWKKKPPAIKPLVTQKHALTYDSRVVILAASTQYSKCQGASCKHPVAVSLCCWRRYFAWQRATSFYHWQLSFNSWERSKGVVLRKDVGNCWK